MLEFTMESDHIVLAQSLRQAQLQAAGVMRGKINDFKCLKEDWKIAAGANGIQRVPGKYLGRGRVREKQEKKEEGNGERKMLGGGDLNLGMMLGGAGGGKWIDDTLGRLQRGVNEMGSTWKAGELLNHVWNAAVAGGARWKLGGVGKGALPVKVL